MRTSRTLLSLVAGLTALAFCGLSPATAADKVDGAAKKITLASIEISGKLEETNADAGLFGDLQPSLRDVVARLDKAGKDKNIAAVLLKIRSPQIGRGKIEELRAAVAKTRKSGKKVYADVDSAMPADYLLATSCDEIVMPESGTLVVPGVRAEVQFYKNLFEKLGVRADILQVGRFKGAGEPFTRSQMSDEFRAQLQSVIDDVYAQMVDRISTTRKLEPDAVKKLLDDGLFTAKKAKELGLIDRVAYADELRKAIGDDKGATEVAVISNYGKKQIDADFSGLGGLFKLVELLSGQEPGSLSLSPHKIAIVYAVGTIMPGESQQGMFGGGTLGGDTIIKALRTAQKDDRVRAIVLRVDSPGGSALASDLMWREIVKSKKPIIASMGDVAASGGYYISMGTQKIYAEPGTLTGSIGVVGGKLAIGGLMDKVGVNTDVISRGRNSGLFSINNPFSDSERKTIQGLMKETYDQFTEKAAQGRKMDLAKLQSMAEGRVFTGLQAKANGLVDEIGTLDDAVAEAKKLGNVPEGEKCELLILPKPKSFFEQLLDGPTVDTRLGQKVQATLPAGVVAPLSDMENLGRLFSEPTLTVLPFTIRVQ
ncbi:MAG: signal peptide peptidase SppA [Planctomycetia bacterium]|nr:signal peptide peptidase SppA [Planctomycetia bacterium]